MQRERIPAWAVAFSLLMLAGDLPGSQLEGNRVSRPAGTGHDTHFSLSRTATFPQIMLWAWEHPEDLTFIDPQKAGVAFLAGTLYLGGGEVSTSPRLQPLKVSPDTVMIATVRIEIDRKTPAEYSSEQLTYTAEAVLGLGHLPGVKGVQIDYDAARSERPFYRSLLNEVRRRLPGPLALSITALSSWCAGDQWLSDRAVPDTIGESPVDAVVDEAVPMLFRMGVDRNEILDDLNEGHDFEPAVCRQSIGVSNDEPWPKLPRGRRVYIFRPGPWTKKAFEDVLRKVS